LARNKQITTVSAKKSSGKKGKIRRMTITPAENGFTTETHREPPAGATGMDQFPEPETNVHESAEAMHAHVGDTFGVQPPAAAPAGGNEEDEAA
jgi:hypothetical protein